MRDAEPASRIPHPALKLELATSVLSFAHHFERPRARARA